MSLKTHESVLWYDECLYHADCLDGAAAAAVVHHFTRTQKYTGVRAGDNPTYTEFPKNQSLMYVDLCPTITHLLKLLKNENQVLIIDHHKSSYEKLAHLVDPLLTKVFDMSHSGCGLTWKYFADPDTGSMPTILKYIEDGDLWAWKHEESKFVVAALNRLHTPITPETILDYMGKNSNQYVPHLVEIGKPIMDKIDETMAPYLRDAVDCTLKKWPQYTVKSVKCDKYNLISYLGNEMSKTCDIALLWLPTSVPNEWKVSLRSFPTGSVDVSKIAMAYEGGGGHMHAAGFVFKGDFDSLFI